MKAPTTYAEWADCLQLFTSGTDDAEALERMRQGNLDMTAGVAERFASRVNEALQTRLKRMNDRFSRSMQVSVDTNSLTNALLLARKEFQLLMNFVSMPVIPSEQSDLLKKALRDQANSMQSSLESSCRNDRSGVLLHCIRNNKINTLD